MGKEFNTKLGPTSIVFGLSMFLFFGMGAISGRWADRYGPRPLLVVGGAMFCAGLVATSFVTAIWQGYIVYGIGCGLGGGIFCSPLFSTVATFFVKYRALAQGVAATGSGFGTLLLVPFAKAIIDTEGWRNSYRILAVISAAGFNWPGPGATVAVAGPGSCRRTSSETSCGPENSKPFPLHLVSCRWR